MTAVRSGGRVLVDALIGQGVDTVFCVPGESFLATLDALYDSRNRIRLIVCRHEAGAANMAEAYGKLTGRPGVVFVTRGPGACHGSIGLHTGFQDSTPMLMLIGQVQREAADREAFQEIDYRRMFGQLAKWVGQIDDAERIPELMSRAFHTMLAGRPGPVVLALPEDMQRDEVAVADLGPHHRVEPHPGAADLARLRELLAAAERPLLLVGGGGWSAQAAADIGAFATANALPVAASFRCQDYVDNSLPCYVGDLGTGPNPALLRRVGEADLLLVIGPRLGEITTQGYKLLKPPRLKQALVHIHADAEELGRVYYPDLAINSSAGPFAAALRALAPVPSPRWADWAQAARADYEASLKPAGSIGALDMSAAMRTLRETLPADSIVTIDAGNFSGWAQRYWPFRRYRSQLGPTSGAMGYGVPAAVAAALVEPERRTVAFVGDGGFLMSGQELATAVQYGARPLVLVFNNGMYGTIRMHQERDFPGRVIGTELRNPDFAALARSFGAFGATVEKTAEFKPALDEALAAGSAALLDLRIDPEAISTRTSLSAIRQASQARRKA
jgi:acetolactate synthase-1/2/3 large subunit